MDDLGFAGIARQRELLRAREASSRELVELYLARIERIDGALNAFRAVLAERALTEADDADRRLANGDEGALLGVPLALKDELDLAGEVTAFGTGVYDEPATGDAEVVRRLRHAGAVIIGKTNLPELAIYGFTDSKTWGITRNPWDLQRTPGGSSGGSGAAVAAGLIGAASASDGAGSIRIPAACCGLFGLKPQAGRVPSAPATNDWYGMSVNGCLTRSVLDSALFLDALIEGPAGPGSPPAPDQPFAAAAQRTPGRLRVAFSAKPARTLGRPIVAAEVKAALADAAALIGALGHEVAWEDPAYGGAGNRVAARYTAGIADDVATVPHPERLERRTRAIGRLGRLYPAWVVARARRLAAADAERIGRLFARFDVLVTPTIGELPPPVGRWEGRSGLRTEIGMSRTYCFTPVWNHTGQPAAAVPLGIGPEGLPRSVQLIGRPNDEATLLSLAAQIEGERPWTERWPPIADRAESGA
jgi:amidase